MKSIALIGFMGCGKSTVGPLLAERLDLPFFDLDSLAENLADMTVSQVFSLEGESGWRQWERRALTGIAESDALVLACGGGVILDAANRDVLKEHFLTIYLDTPVEELVARLRRTKDRPLLDVADPKKTIAGLLKERRPLYKTVADLVVDTGRKTPQEVVIETAAAISKQTEVS